ncbi:MAG: hypothetical protein RL328_1253, partial [Acidobacteriota bacterium]
DKGPAALGAFARNAQFPLVSANLDVDSEPALAGRVQRSVILTRNGEHIGIVGGITDDALNISSPGPNVRLREQHSGLQTEIDGLTRQGVNKIVLLTHIGYQPELELARTLHNVDVIVGGHSHTLLGTTTAPGFPSSQGPYPTIVDNPDQGKTIVVQSWEGEKVLGRIQVTFDEQGRVTRWSSTQPVLVDETVPEQPALRALLAAFEKPIAQQRDRKVAEAAEPLAQSALGAIIADAMLAATANRKSVAAFIQGGGVRAALEPGAITYGAALAVQPFNDTLVVMDLTGAQILQALEDNSSNAGRILWTSAGTGYTLDASKPAGARISDLRIAGKPVDPVAAYRVVVQDYLANGGDNAITLKNSSGFREDTRLLDIDIFLDYLAAHSPVRTPAEVRVTRK